MKLYLIIGQEGDYEDYTMWVVCAYKDKKSADEHARLSNGWCEQKLEQVEEISDPEDRYDQIQKLAGKNPYDKIGDYLESTYHVEPVEVRTSLPRLRKGRRG